MSWSNPCFGTKGYNYLISETSTIQAFSQDLKSGYPKCALGSVQMNNL